MSQERRAKTLRRDQGRRRVTVATRWTAVTGTALAAVFGLTLAQHSAASTNASADTAKASKITAPPRIARSTPTTTQSAPSTTTHVAPTATTTEAPKPPLRWPTTASGRHHSSSGAS